MLEDPDDVTLLLALLVNHRLYSVILSNRSLQQRLCLAYTGVLEIIDLDPRFRPLLANRPRILVGTVTDQDVDALPSKHLQRVPSSQYTQPATLNPSLLDVPRSRNENEWPARSCFGKYVPPGRLSDSSPLRGMYLSHPMPTHVRFRIPTTYSPRKLQDYVVRGRRDGLLSGRLGELMDEVANEFDEHRPPFFDRRLPIDWASANVELHGRRMA